MLPAMSPYPQRRGRRKEGNVTFIETQFATRLRFLVVWHAQREARERVIRKLKGEGRRVSLMSASEINALAVAYLRANAAELLAQAEASGLVQNLRQTSRESTLFRQRNL
jgi:hypothetical protein